MHSTSFVAAAVFATTAAAAALPTNGTHVTIGKRTIDMEAECRDHGAPQPHQCALFTTAGVTMTLGGSSPPFGDAPQIGAALVMDSNCKTIGSATWSPQNPGFFAHIDTSYGTSVDAWTNMIGVNDIGRVNGKWGGNWAFDQDKGNCGTTNNPMDGVAAGYWRACYWSC